MFRGDTFEGIGSTDFMICLLYTSRTIVSKLLHKTQNKQQTKTENNKFITLTYINKQTEKIAHKFKNKLKNNNKLCYLNF